MAIYFSGGTKATYLCRSRPRPHAASQHGEEDRLAAASLPPSATSSRCSSTSRRCSRFFNKQGHVVPAGAKALNHNLDVASACSPQCSPRATLDDHPRTRSAVMRDARAHRKGARPRPAAPAFSPMQHAHAPHTRTSHAPALLRLASPRLPLPHPMHPTRARAATQLAEDEHRAFGDAECRVCSPASGEGVPTAAGAMQSPVRREWMRARPVAASSDRGRAPFANSRQVELISKPPPPPTLPLPNTLPTTNTHHTPLTHPSPSL